MSQQEGETNYKYEDYASEMAFHRIAQTDALTGHTFRITLESKVNYVLEFVEHNKVIWKSGNEGGTDWCEVVEVAPVTYFIDMTFASEPHQCQTFIINTDTRRVLGVRTIMREGDVGKEPRAVQQFVPGVLGDPSVAPSGRKPSPTRDLIGLRALYIYNPNQVFEHVYLNAQRFAWHCVVGPLRGEADVELTTTYKFDDNQYILSWRETGLPVATVFFHNWDQMKETGKFFAIGEDGAIANTPAGAIIEKLSVSFYPSDKKPV